MNKQNCIENCTKCHQACLSLVNHCLKMGGEHASAAHIRLLRDCAEICQTSANFMLRDSPLHHLTCGTCAEVCRQCASECQQMGGADVLMTECAQACLLCADSCHQMSKMVAR